MSTDPEYTGQQNINLTIRDDHQTIAKEAAKQIAEAIRVKKARGDEPFVLGLATGVTMEPVYAELIRMHKEDNLSFANVKFFNLDNYKGLKGGENDRNSYGVQLRQLFLNQVDAKAENIDLMPTSAEPADLEGYERRIKAAGGIDIQLLGLGGEGHIGFNEVGSAFNSRTRTIKLSPRTKADNAHFFDKEGESVPSEANTMGIATILEAKQIIALASGDSKAYAIRQMMDSTGKNEIEASGEIPYGLSPQEIADGLPVEKMPARALHAHPNLTMLVDRKAAHMVLDQDLLTHSNYNTPEKASELLDSFAPKEIEVEINGEKKPLLISAGFDFYDPATMQLDERFSYDNPAHVTALGDYLSKATDSYTGAHQDDAEIWAGSLILDAQRDPAKHWLNIILTDGAASKSKLNLDTMQIRLEDIPVIRWKEQRKAAEASKTPVIQLGYPSAAVNHLMGNEKKEEVAQVLKSLFSATPNMTRLYGHQPLDKHDTHLGTFASWISAIRAAIPPKRLEKVVAMEGWSGLDGMPDNMLEKAVIKNEDDLKTIKGWIEVYESQILLQGRNYADVGIANAQSHGGFVTSPHQTDIPAGMQIGLNVTEYIKDIRHGVGSMVNALLDKLESVKTKKAGQHETVDVRAKPWAGRTVRISGGEAAQGI